MGVVGIGYCRCPALFTSKLTACSTVTSYNHFMDRINKFLAHAGLGSRRHCEGLVLAGRVQVDGKSVRDLATRIEPGQSVTVDGKPVGAETFVYWAVNKPVGYLCTNRDPGGRPTAIDLVPDVPQRVYTV